MFRIMAELCLKGSSIMLGSFCPILLRIYPMPVSMSWFFKKLPIFISGEKTKCHSRMYDVHLLQMVYSKQQTYQVPDKGKRQPAFYRNKLTKKSDDYFKIITI